MTDTKTTPVKEGEISFQDLENSSFSFDVDSPVISTDPEVEVVLNEEEDIENDTPNKEKKEIVSEEEEEKVSSDDTKDEEEDIVETNKDTNISYKSLSTKYLEQGIWEDVEVEIEEGKAIKLSELEDLDEDTFIEIQKAQRKFLDDDVESKFISKEGIDENGLKLLEIVKNGGDIRTLFDKPEDAVRPFENVDLENEKIQESILFQQYRMQGLSESESVNLVSLAKKNLTMDEKVQQIVNYHQKKYDDFLTSKVEEQKKARQEEEARVKEFKKGVLETLRDNFKLKDTLARKLTNLGVDKNENGEFQIDEIYSKKMEDPKEAADLLYFLSDKEGYLKMVGAKTKRDTNLNTIRKINILKDKQKPKSKEEETSKSELEFSVT